MSTGSRFAKALNKGVMRRDTMSIYEQMKATGVEIGSHESDLYVPVTEETTAIVNAYEFKGNVTRFTSQIDKKPWYDIPFAYEPHWPRNRS
jgi:hypothetical protein